VSLSTSLPSPAARAPRRPRPSRRVGLLVLTAFALAALATVVVHAAGLALLVAATLALGVASAQVMRAQWHAAVPPEPRPVTRPAREDRPSDDELAVRLRELHASHVEKVNLALDEGREDLARELADAYADQALALLTRA
jgi:hypothetical protein